MTGIVLRALVWALSVYSWLILARALLSWFPLRYGTPLHRVYRFLYDVTEPYLRLFRRFIPPLRTGGGAFDVSPVLGLIVLFIVIRVLSAI